MAYQDYGGAPPPKPPTPPAPPAAGEQAAAVEQTAAQKAGWEGDTKESGSDPNRGDKQWDPQWEKRMRAKLGDKVGSLGDLYDPKHRQWLNKQARKQKGGGGGAEEVAPTGEETPVEEEVTPENEATTGLPVAQGSADQLKGLETPAWGMPERQVPGGDKTAEMQDPTSQMETGLWTPEDEARQAGGATRDGQQEQMQTGLWTPEDEARASAADQAEGLDGGAGGGTAPTGEMFVTNAGIAPPEYPKPNTGSKFAQPTSPWPPPPVQPTYYTGGM